MKLARILLTLTSVILTAAVVVLDVAVWSASHRTPTVLAFDVAATVAAAGPIGVLWVLAIDAWRNW